MTGAAPADLVRNVASAAFLGTVLDYVLTEDQLVIAFCDSRGLPYTAPMQARVVLESVLAQPVVSAEWPAQRILWRQIH